MGFFFTNESLFVSLVKKNMGTVRAEFINPMLANNKPVKVKSFRFSHCLTGKKNTNCTYLLHCFS